MLCYKNRIKKLREAQTHKSTFLKNAQAAKRFQNSPWVPDDFIPKKEKKEKKK